MYTMVVLPLRVNGEIGRQEPYEVQQEEMKKSCIWGGLTPMHQDRLGPSIWKAAWQRKAVESWWTS